MANYAYIRYPKKIQCETPEKTFERFAEDLREFVRETLGDRWRVAKAPFDYDGETWIVSIPGTAVNGKKATRGFRAPGEDSGFVVSLNLEVDSIVFRRSPNLFESWAQGRLAEALAEAVGKPLFFDATNEKVPPGTIEYRRGKTFRDYLARNFDKPLSAEDEAWIERHRNLAPEGFW